MKRIKIIILLFLLVLVAPIFSIISLSFQNNGKEIFKWYFLILSNGDFKDSLILSFYISAFTAILTTIVSCILSLTWFDKKQRITVVVLIFILGLLPPDIMALSLTKIVQLFGFYDSNLFLLVIGLSMYCLPYAIIILWVRFYFIENNLIAASKDLGIKNFYIIIKIILPLSSVAIISSTILSFLLAFNEYPRTYYLSGSYQLISEYLNGKLGSGTDPSIYAGGSIVVLVTVIAIISLFLFYIFNQKRRHFKIV